MRRRSIDPYSGRPLYRQLADILRGAITAGELRPGVTLPTAKRLAGDYELGVDAVRDALAVLRGEGLIETVRGKGSRVRVYREPAVVNVPPGSVVTARMPTERERQELGVLEGTPVIVVTEADGSERVYAADRTELHTTGEAEPGES
jgi:DNA-binding FadR family transcriptional regulator